MGNGRKSGLSRYKSQAPSQAPSLSVTINSTDNEAWQEWQNKTIQDAMQDYSDLRYSMSNNDLYNQGLNGTGLQRAVLAMGLAGPGRIMPDEDFDKAVSQAALHGMELYRGSSAGAINNLINGDVAYIGEGIHGDGIYFSTDLSTARMYGSHRVTAFIDKGLAKVITEERLWDMRNNESPDVQRVFGGDSGLSSYALYKGYNVIHVPGGNSGDRHSIAARGKSEGEDYYVPLTRTVLVFRKHTK